MKKCDLCGEEGLPIVFENGMWFCGTHLVQLLALGNVQLLSLESAAQMEAVAELDEFRDKGGKPS